MESIILPLFVAIISGIVYMFPVGRLNDLALKAFHASMFVTLLVFAQNSVRFLQ